MSSSWLLITLLSLIASVSALYSANDAVIQINPSTWDTQVTNTKHVVLVEFFAPWCGHCKALAPEYKQAAESLKGLVKVAAVDCDDHRELCSRYGVKGFPTIKVFGSDKSLSPVDYKGQRKATDLVDFVVPMISDKFVTQIGSNSNRVAMKEFLEKDKLPKVVLFNKKYSIPPLYRALSVEFEDKISFGEIKSTEDALAKQYGVDEFPTVLTFNSGEETPTRYTGFMKYKGLYSHFKSMLGESATGEGEFDPTVPELTSQADLEKHCINESILCAIAFINLEPEFPESVKAHQEALDILKSVRLKLKSRASSFKLLWVNSIEHGHQLMRAADVSDILPGMLGLHVKRSFYRNFRGAFDQQGVEQFVSDMLLGLGGGNVRLQFDVQLDKVKKDEL